MSRTVDIIRYVRSASGPFITVKQWEECDGCVSFKTEGHVNQKYFGKFSITISPKMATTLGRAILACSDELSKRPPSTKVKTDVVRQVYCEEGQFITILPWQETPQTVCMITDGEENEEYFGRINVALNLKMANEVAKALINCASEI